MLYYADFLFETNGYERIHMDYQNILSDKELEKLGINVVQIFITPIEEAVSYCHVDSYVVIGTKDKAYEIYKDYCDANGIKVLYIKDANHSLEVERQPYQSINILKSVMEFIER